jgi:flagellar hook-basal body complex protein FliE
LISQLDSKLQEALSKVNTNIAKNGQKLVKDLEKNPKNFAEAWNAALKKVDKSTQKNFSKVRDFIANTIDQIADWGADAFIDFTTGTKSAAEAFSDMATSILRDLTKMIIKQQILNAIMAGAKSMSTSGGILGTVGGFLNDAFATNHSGGMAGKASSIKKRMDPSNFINAPKYHSGGEVPAILQRGEEVRTREQAAMDRTKQPISVIIENKTGSQVGSAEVTQTMDAGQQVINIVLDGISRNRGGLRTAIAQTR